MSKHVVKYGIVLLAGATVAGCSANGDETPDPVGPGPSISLSIAPTSGAAHPGESRAATVTLIRAGGFTGDVNLTVSGEYPGIHAVVSNVHTVGAATIATVTWTVGAATLPSSYTFTLRGTGSGVSDVTASYILTVTPAVINPGSYLLTLSPAALIIVQGAATPTTMVNLLRTNFTGSVTLGVDFGDCHGELPGGVSAAFTPNPATGNSSVLTFTVGLAAVPGVYDLYVSGNTTAGFQLAPLRLTVAPPGNFTLTTQAPSVSVVQGNNVNVPVTINRTGGNTSAVALTATGTVPVGMTLSLVPISTTTNSAELAVTTTIGTSVGAYPIVIHGTAAGLAEQLANLTINVTAPGGSPSVSGTGNGVVVSRFRPLAIAPALRMIPARLPAHCAVQKP